MNAETIHLKLVGERPLLMHSGRLADPLEPIVNDLAKVTAKRMKTRADHEEIARIEWYGGLWLSNGLPCLPPEAIEGTFIAAARSRKKGKQACAGLLVEGPALLDYEGSTDPDELWKDENFRLRHGVRVKNARTMRTRALFKKWRAHVTVTFLPTLLNRAEVIEIFRVAGFQEGLGDWRPKFGKFTVEVLED
jgi:hypothetical protein